MAKRYAYHEYPPTQSFGINGVIDTQTGRPIDTFNDKATAEAVVVGMNKADKKARDDVAPYVQVIDSLAALVAATAFGKVSKVTPEPLVAPGMVPPPGVV